MCSLPVCFADRCAAGAAFVVLLTTDAAAEAPQNEQARLVRILQTFYYVLEAISKRTPICDNSGAAVPYSPTASSTVINLLLWKIKKA